jgi:hypothetical protein
MRRYNQERWWEFEVRDELVAHIIPSPHLDFYKITIYFPVPEDKM